MHDVILLSSIVEFPLTDPSEDGRRWIAVDPTGEPHAAAVVDAAAADYHLITGRPRPTHHDLLALLTKSATLTLQTVGSFGARSIMAVEGRVLLRPFSHRLMLLPRSSTDARHGVDLGVDQVLDIEPGFEHAPAAQARVEQVCAHLPTVEPLRRQHLQALPEHAADATRIGLAVFGTWGDDADSSAGAIWLLHSYRSEDDIAEGCLLLRPGDGVSEHGSFRGRDLLQSGGRIVNPPPLSLADALHLVDVPYREALARFVTRTDTA